MRTLAMIVSVAAVLALVAAVPAAETARPLVGKSAPEIAAQYWLNSSALSLKALQGKIVVVEFWATWCPPCRQSIPHLIQLSGKYGPQGVVFIGLTDEPKEKVEPFAKEMHMTYAIAGGSGTAQAYGVTGIPTAFLLDTEGKVVWQGHPMNPAFVAAIESQLKKTPPAVMSTQDKLLAKVLLDKAEQTIKVGELADASAAMAKLPKLDEPAVRERAEAVRKALADAVAQFAAEADKLIEAKDYYKASLALTQIAGAGATLNACGCLPTREHRNPLTIMPSAEDRRLAYSRHGARFGRSTQRFNSGSPTICSFTGSNLNARPVQKAMLARWHVATVRWAISMSRNGRSRVLTQ
jgi:thiol-disulfide isomerase/thioredoxin